MIPAYLDKLPATKSSQSNRIAFYPCSSSPVPAGLMTLTSDRDATDYAVAETPTDWTGRAFHVARMDGSESYSVFCGLPVDSRCDCRGFERWGFCRHVTAITRLVSEGQI